MSDIYVRFDKGGFYHHPAYGRLGYGKEENHIYRLPVEFGASGGLPSSAEILDRTGAELVVEEDEGAVRIQKPKVVDQEQLERTITGRGQARKQASAQERTAPSRTRNRRKLED